MFNRNPRRGRVPLALASFALVVTAVAQPGVSVADDATPSLREQALALTNRATTLTEKAGAAGNRALAAKAKSSVLARQAKASRKAATVARDRAALAARQHKVVKAKQLQSKATELRSLALRRSTRAENLNGVAKSARAKKAKLITRSSNLRAQAAALIARANNAESRTQNEALLAETLAGWGIPGAQVVHTKDGVTDSYTYGVQDTSTGAEVTEHSLFQAASLTKSVASYVFMKRVDEGVIDLDTPLSQYWQSPRAVQDPAVSRITARMVLNHTTGLPNWMGAANDESTQLVTKAEPGTTWGYSGEGFFLLQRTIEHLDGQLFAETLEEEVFEPFGMVDSTLVTRDEDAPRTTVGHSAVGVPTTIRVFTSGNAAYTLMTSAHDYDRFIQQALLGGGELSESAHKLWTEVSSNADQATASPADPYINWGLGVGLQTNGKGKAIWHWGDNGTRRAFFMAYPGTGESIAVFWNSTNGQKSAPAILTQFLGKQAFHALTWVG